MAITNYTKPNWTQHIMRKQQPNNSNNSGGIVYTSDSSGSLATSNSKNQCSDTRTPESDCDSERKYPDLLDISSLSNPNSGSSSNLNKNSSNSAFCTFPRKKHHSTGKYIKAVSDSQSPLLPSDCSSRYGSSNFSGEHENTNRRLSIDSYANYPLSIYSTNKDAGRSNSFLNLVTPHNMVVKSLPHRRNPSLPSSPIKESKKAETPLLDFTSLAARASGGPPVMAGGTPSPSTSTTASAYDYHAAQLERFLEEYRNLQEQLCKMKETCDSIRKKETPHRNTLGQSAKFADPLMYSAAALSTTPSLPEDATNPNPKGILKNKSLIPGQPPDPPPYWLHRNAILKRLQDPGAGDFFQS